VVDDAWKDTMCTEARLRPGTTRFGLRILARLSGDHAAGVELGADPARGDLASIKHAATHAIDATSRTDRLNHEHRVLRSLDHRGVRRSFGVRRQRDGLRLTSTALLLRFVDGATIDRWQSPDLPELCRTMAGVCRALAHVHERGWVHGNLRPGHVIIDESDRPTVISFGRALRSGAMFPGDSIGHPYASPEELDGGVATPRADVFGVGATLAAVLLRRPLSTVRSGESDHDRRSRFDEWNDQLAEAAVHPPLRRIVLKAMHPDPRRRPAFIEAIGSHLQDLSDTLHQRRRLAA
jgi:serine/threonine protein kinase